MNEPSASSISSRWPRIRKAVRATLPFFSGVIAVLVALALYNALMPPVRLLTTGDVNTSIAQAIASITPRPPIAPLIYQKIQPSLVLIETLGQDSASEDDDGLGSGVIIDDKGDILTCLHVVANSTSIQLTFADGTKSSAQIAIRQPENDIAVLRPSRLPKVLVPATLGNPNAMHIGDEAFVVGHPFGLYGSMSSGVISGLNRSFQASDSTASVKNLIQIDAAVNPGNSGGPLLNRSGQVIGIITSLLNPTKQDVFIGIGFAVPITTAGGAAGMPPV